MEKRRRKKMIFDAIKNIGQYKGISKNLDTAICFIEKTDLETLPLGKTEIDGDNVYVTVMNVETKDASELGFEIHKQYMDIQLDLEGTEKFYIGLGKKEATAPFQEENDFGPCKVEQQVECVMGKGKFIVCMVEEAHLPSAKAGDDCKVKKAVFKVKNDIQ